MAYIDASNATLLNAVREYASLDYKNRVPVASDSNLERVMAAIREYEPTFNEYARTLVNRIGLTVLDQNLVWENKLKPLKSGAMNYGDTIQELSMDLIKAKRYDPDETDVFNGQKIDVVADYHKLNRQDVYDYKVNDEQLTMASIHDGQLANMVNGLFYSPFTSAEQDEYQYMLQLAVSYHTHEPGGFANVHVEDIATSPDPKEAATALSLAIRTMYLYNKGFLRNEFNPQHVPVAAPELVLLVDPVAIANMDVRVLANAFHTDKAEFMADRVIIIDKWPKELEGTQALLIDRNWYRCYDTLRRQVSIYNPATLDMVYYYHLWGVLSVSRQKTAIRFSTDPTNIPGVTVGKTREAQSVEVATNATPGEGTDNYKFEAGDVITLGAEVTYDDGTKDEGAFFIITGVTADGETEPVIPESGTYIDEFSKLRISPHCVFKTLTVTAVANHAHTVVKAIKLTNSEHAEAASLDDGFKVETGEVNPLVAFAQGVDTTEDEL